MKWKTVKLSSCCLSIADGDHQPPPKAESGIPFVTISNIQNNHFNFSGCMYVPQSYYDNLHQKRKPQKYDILYSVVGSFGIPVLNRDNSAFVFQRHIAILRPDKDVVDPVYMYYAMLNKEFYLQADAAAIGVAQRTISLSSLQRLMLPLPDLPTQHRIASILSAYDDLIENNRRQIKLLEEAAQRLYREWFVELRFPGHENVKIVDGVPEGWEKIEVGTCISNVSKTKQVMTAEFLKTGSIPVIDQSRSFIAGYTNDKETIVDLGIPAIVFGDHTRVLKYIPFPFAKGADGTQIIATNNERMPQSLFYHSLLSIDLSNYHYARHFKYLKAEKILLPSLEIAHQFDSVVSSQLMHVQVLRDKCRIIAEARDRLLPKLMSGEMEV